MSQPPRTVIDLTDEPDTPPQATFRHLHPPSSPRATRPPRFSRGDIIDLEERSDRPAQHVSQNNAGSPELELLYTRSIPAEAQARRQHGVAGYARPVEPQPQLAGPGDFQRVSRQGWNGNGPGGLARLQELARRINGGLGPAVAAAIRGEQGIRQEVARMAQPAPVIHRRPVVPALEDELFVFEGHGEIDLPRVMDYEIAGFAMVTPPPTYKAPSPAQEGFTRSPREEDVLNWELVRRSSSVKSGSPGHVATPKPKGKIARPPTKTKPFAHCQVVGCGKSVRAPRSMFQVYL
ncbi:MAG: hypothetical protein M1830_001530 [Pleopsidium flavum]|nr:MAG: hypothetical protein M1830_001530 [Pleopsidium flavum]